MLTPTPRLGLLRPEDLDQAQIEDLNHNADLLDAAKAIATVVTGALPATPWDGQLVWDQTNKQLKIYAGGAWQTIVSVPAGGAVNTVLTKSSATAYAMTWKLPDPAQWERGAASFSCPSLTVVDTGTITFGTPFTATPIVTYGYSTTQNGAGLLIEVLGLTAAQLSFRIRNTIGSTASGSIYWHATL